MVIQPVIYPERKLYQQAGGLFTTETATVRIDTKAEKGIITRYTTDGKDPDQSSPEYKAPFTVNKTTVVKAKSFDEKGNGSLLSTAYFRMIKPGMSNGLTTTFYQGNELSKLPQFGMLKKGSSWISSEFNISRDQINGLLEKGNESFALQFSGFIQIDTPGKYTFSTQSDDGSKLYIDGKEVVDNDGNHGVTEETGSIELTAGKHPVLVEYYNNGGGFWLDAFYKGPGTTKQLIPADKLFVK